MPCVPQNPDSTLKKKMEIPIREVFASFSVSRKKLGYQSSSKASPPTMLPTTYSNTTSHAGVLTVFKNTPSIPLPSSAVPFLGMTAFPPDTAWHGSGSCFRSSLKSHRLRVAHSVHRLCNMVYSIFLPLIPFRTSVWSYVICHYLTSSIFICLLSVSPALHDRGSSVCKGFHLVSLLHFITSHKVGFQ